MNSKLIQVTNCPHWVSKGFVCFACVVKMVEG
jgi:hypothetical protein